MFESAYRVHVMPRWGAVSVADVNVLGVESWIAGMVRAGSGVTTVSRAHVVLSGILSDAVKSKRLAVNPAPRCGEPAAPNGQETRLPVRRRCVPAGRRVG